MARFVVDGCDQGGGSSEEITPCAGWLHSMELTMEGTTVLRFKLCTKHRIEAEERLPVAPSRDSHAS